MDAEAWLSDLFEQNYALLYRIGRIFLGSENSRDALIEDQIQETFLRAWQKRRKLQKHPNPEGWLVECFRKCLMNACRKQSRNWDGFTGSSPEALLPDQHTAAQQSPEEYVRAREQIELLHRLLGDTDADIFLRYCVHGEKASVLASEIGISEPALRMRVSRIKRKVLANHELFTCLIVLCLLNLR